MKLALANCFWLIVPALLWNAYFASRLNTTGFGDDASVPPLVLTAEALFRIVVFAAPVLLPIRLDGRLGRVGIALLIVGYVIYFASWFPHLAALDTSLARSIPAILAPSATPIILFFGVALIGRSWLFGVASVLFIVFHVTHGLYNLQTLGTL